MSESQVDPHDKMRARDVNKVARGEQAPKPAHEYGTVSPAPPPSSTDHITDKENKVKSQVQGQVHHPLITKRATAMCLEEKGKSAPECEKIATYFRQLCQSEWVTEWDEERERGVFPGEI